MASTVSITMDVKTANAIQKLQELLRAEQAVAGGVEDIGGKAKKTQQSLGQLSVKNFVTGLAGLVGVHQVLGRMGTAIDEIKEKFDRAREAGGRFGEEFKDIAAFELPIGIPERKKLVDQMAETANIGMADAAAAVELLISNLPELDVEGIRRTIPKLGAFKKITALPMTDIVSMFTSAIQDYPEAKPQEIGNAIKFISQQGRKPIEQIAPQLPRFFGAGTLSGLKFEEIAGLSTFATRLASTEMAATAVESLLREFAELRAAAAEPIPRGHREITGKQKIARDLGVTPETTFAEFAAKLKGMPELELQKTFEARAIRLASPISKQFEKYQQDVALAAQQIKGPDLVEAAQRKLEQLPLYESQERLKAQVRAQEIMALDDAVIASQIETQSKKNQRATEQMFGKLGSAITRPFRGIYDTEAKLTGTMPMDSEATDRLRDLQLWLDRIGLFKLKPGELPTDNLFAPIPGLAPHGGPPPGSLTPEGQENIRRRREIDEKEIRETIEDHESLTKWEEVADKLNAAADRLNPPKKETEPLRPPMRTKQ